ncbi:MAG: RidA family protein [Peptostreptococcaceae bacterium]|jgi:enamine deaminase RidA (YjgF/YER057c/UK114 family)|nr:RidA family protein [Peptostreptococcaceae bacterium]
MCIEERLKNKNIILPPFNNAVANYSPAVKTQSLIFTAGQTPRYNGELKYKGKLNNQNIKKGMEAARLCVLNCLSIIKEYAGGLDNIVQIVKINGFVNSEADFIHHAKVMNGATDLLVDIFGDIGRPARSSVGTNSLPGDAMVEVEMIVEILESDQK